MLKTYELSARLHAKTGVRLSVNRVDMTQSRSESLVRSSGITADATLLHMMVLKQKQSKQWQDESAMATAAPSHLNGSWARMPVI